MSEGPTIAIIFKAAEGVEAGKTFVKYKDVNIGQVTAVQLSPDYSKVEVTAKIAKSAAGLMVEDAMFWVVNRASLSAACRALAHCCRGTSSDLRPEHPKSSSVLSLDWNFSRL
jgi:paraquat-inducible protein B